MANIKGIEVSSQVYDLEDETGRAASEDNAAAIGTLSNLETTAKTNLVSAINEVNSTANDNTDNIGDLSDLDTTAKTNLVSAINEVNENVEKKNLLWSNPNPAATMANTSINLSISANAKGLLIRAGSVSNSENSVFEEKVYFAANKTTTVAISQSFIDFDSSEQYIFSRSFDLNKAHTKIDVGFGSRLTINTDDSTMSVSQENGLIVPQEIYEIL